MRQHGHTRAAPVPRCIEFWRAAQLDADERSPQLSDCVAARRRAEGYRPRAGAATGRARTRFWRAVCAGPYLYGAFSNADAYFAPVVFRFNTYGVKCSPVVADYVKAMLAHPSMQQWAADSRAEPQVVDHEEPGVPVRT